MRFIVGYKYRKVHDLTTWLRRKALQRKLVAQRLPNYNPDLPLSWYMHGLDEWWVGNVIENCNYVAIGFPWYTKEMSQKYWRSIIL